EHARRRPGRERRADGARLRQPVRPGRRPRRAHRRRRRPAAARARRPPRRPARVARAARPRRARARRDGAPERVLPPRRAAARSGTTAARRRARGERRRRAGGDPARGPGADCGRGSRSRRRSRARAPRRRRAPGWRPRPCLAGRRARARRSRKPLRRRRSLRPGGAAGERRGGPSGGERAGFEHRPVLLLRPRLRRPSQARGGGPGRRHRHRRARGRFRPDLDARALESALVGSARPLAGAPAAAQGNGVVDLAAAATAEVVAEPPTLSFGRAAGRGWSAERTLLLRNVSTRPLRIDLAAVPARVRSGVAIGLDPGRVVLAPGASAPVRVTARLAGRARASAAAGWLTATPVPTAGTAVRIPWAVVLAPPGEVVGAAELSSVRFRPSDVRPAILRV